MLVRCPLCDHKMKVKQPDPGSYKPKCGKCKQRFSLWVPINPEDDVIVKALEKQPTKSKKKKAPPSKADTPEEPNVAQATAAGGIDQTFVPEEPSPSIAAEKTAGNKIEATFIPSKEKAASVAEQPTRNQQPGAIEGTFVTDGEAGKSVAAQPTRQQSQPKSAVTTSAPTKLGGYKIQRELGRGAMGTVYLANQISLDRDVALKTIQTQWADNPVSLARFTREAYSAAQLTHHNVVQIYDFGSDAGVNFFSMEFVNGESLHELQESRKKLEPKEAIGYIIQAARGLRFAHNRGMVHRDIKPANLMINEEGIVKVGDLGLVKTPELLDIEEEGAPDNAALASATAEITIANSVMGTPAFMAPEQTVNAAGVDHRADIYSLGVTLYVMLTGRVPFEGATALEVITKVRSEPIVRPETFDGSIEPKLSDIIMKMVAKEPDERYANIDQVIDALEDYLHAGSRPLNEQAAEELRTCMKQYNSSTTATLRGWAIPALAAGCGLLALVCLLFSWSAAVGLVTVPIAAAIAWFVVGGIRTGSHLFEKAKQSIGLFRITDWGMWGLGVLLFLAVLFFLGGLFVWLACVILGVAIGVGLHFAIDGRVASERYAAVQSADALFKKLRLAGVGEEELQQFVVQQSENHWEEFFEELFGYEEKVAARSLVKGSRPKYAAWRDSFIARLNRKLEEKQQQQEQSHLAKVEEASLKAQGVSAAEARSQAQNMAAAIVDDAAALQLAQPATQQKSPEQIAIEKRARIKAMLADARSGKYKKKESGEGVVTTFLNLLFGARARFALGCLLLLGCLAWANQNGLLSRETAEAITNNAADSVVAETNPLALPVVGRFFASYLPGVAGLFLIFSGLSHGWKMSLFALPAAAIWVLGPAMGMPGIDFIGGSTTTSLAIGAIPAVLGLLLGRTKTATD